MASKTKKSSKKHPAVKTTAAEIEAVLAAGADEVGKKSRVKKQAEPKPVLDAERLEWVAQNARPAVAPCLCGCGGTTKGRFFPGHDTKLKALLKNTGGDQAEQALAAFGW